MNLNRALATQCHKFERILIYRQSDSVVLCATHEKTGLSSILIFSFSVTSELPLILRSAGPFKDQDEIANYMKVAGFAPDSREECQGIVGLTKFLEGYYLVYVKKSQVVAKIGAHQIRQVKETGIIRLFNAGRHKAQSAYLSRLQNYALQNCYFSYTYEVTRPLAYNLVKHAEPLYRDNFKYLDPPADFAFGADSALLSSNEIFTWNYSLIGELAQLASREWILPIAHGFLRQISIFVRDSRFQVTLFARRSRHHAGTRYLKRGINQNGFVANFVQTEQIVWNPNKKCDISSFVQVRGSAPVFWFQRPSILVAKPAIELMVGDNYYLATEKHFRDLAALYGQNIFCINLMKAKESIPRESLLSEQFEYAVGVVRQRLGPTINLQYAQFDMKNRMKESKDLFLKKAAGIALLALSHTGYFLVKGHSTRKDCQQVCFQNGVIRSNCVDCLDRTNSFQLLLSETALSSQVKVLLGEEPGEPGEFREQFAEFRQIYQELGDLVSIQYGSSLAHKQKVSDSKNQKIEFLTSVKRHFNNNVTDNDRQELIDVFLRHCPCNEEGPSSLKSQIQHAPNKKVLLPLLEKWPPLALLHFKQVYSLPYLAQRTQSGRLEPLLGPRDAMTLSGLQPDLAVRLTPQFRSQKFEFILKKPQILSNKFLWREDQKYLFENSFQLAVQKLIPLVKGVEARAQKLIESQEKTVRPVQVKTLPPSRTMRLRQQLFQQVTQLAKELQSCRFYKEEVVGDLGEALSIQEQVRLMREQTLKEKDALMKNFQYGVYFVVGEEEQKVVRQDADGSKDTVRQLNTEECKEQVLQQLMNSTFICGTRTCVVSNHR